MAKVAYNACFGGFTLSDQAMARYAELKNIKLYSEPDIMDCSIHWMEPRTGDDETDRSRRIFSCSSIERHDPALIRAIEELGESKASGRFARLRVRDVPDGASYRIDEYNGKESVMTVGDYEWKVAGGRKAAP